MRGEDNHRQAGVTLLDFAEQRQPVHLIHTQIADDEIDLLFLQQAQRFRPAGGGGDLVTFAAEAHPQQL